MTAPVDHRPPGVAPGPRLGVAVVALCLALTQSHQVLAHAKGLYKTQAEAEQRAAATPWTALKASCASGLASGWTSKG
ncbi:MAG: hypothetical protein ACK52U_11190, partial [Synechococcaceae cyanobacterium]